MLDQVIRIVKKSEQKGMCLFTLYRPVGGCDTWLKLSVEHPAMYLPTFAYYQRVNVTGVYDEL